MYCLSWLRGARRAPSRIVGNYRSYSPHDSAKPCLTRLEPAWVWGCSNPLDMLHTCTWLRRLCGDPPCIMELYPTSWASLCYAGTHEVTKKSAMNVCKPFCTSTSKYVHVPAYLSCFAYSSPVPRTHSYYSAQTRSATCALARFRWSIILPRVDGPGNCGNRNTVGIHLIPVWGHRVSLWLCLAQ